MIKADDTLLNLLREKEDFMRLNEYISQNKIKKSISSIIKKLNRKINKEIHNSIVWHKINNNKQRNAIDHC